MNGWKKFYKALAFLSLWIICPLRLVRYWRRHLRNSVLWHPWQGLKSSNLLWKGVSSWSLWHMALATFSFQRLVSILTGYVQALLTIQISSLFMLLHQTGLCLCSVMWKNNKLSCSTLFVKQYSNPLKFSGYLKSFTFHPCYNNLASRTWGWGLFSWSCGCEGAPKWFCWCGSKVICNLTNPGLKPGVEDEQYPLFYSRDVLCACQKETQYQPHSAT